MKTAIIVGAAGGMGKIVAKTLAAKGYSLALLDSNKSALSNLEDEIKIIYHDLLRYGKVWSRPELLTFNIDIRDNINVEKSFQSIEERFAKVDVLFSSAGIFTLDKSLTHPADAKALFDVNYFGNMNCVNAILPSMRANKEGHIIVVCTRGVEFPRMGTGIYSGSKAALHNTLESLAKTSIADNVKITTINPAITNTPMASISKIPPERMIQPEDIAKTVKYLLKLSPGAVIPTLTIACGVDMETVAVAESSSAYNNSPR